MSKGSGARAWGRLAKTATGLFPKVATIRGKIFFAFCALAAITVFLGISSIHSVVKSGQLVAEIYDKPLMAISYARYALAQFTEMELLVARRVATNNRALQRRLDERSAQLAASIKQNISVARERALSAEAADAADEAATAVAAWESARHQFLAANSGKRTHLVMEAASVRGAFDNLVERTTLDGFRHREQALRTIDSYRRIGIEATIGALLLAILITIQLARHMIRPIAVASHAASRIAEGELDVQIESSTKDELGRLLGSMAVMRDNIRTMMQHEVDARQSAQTRLVNAIESSDQGVILADADNRLILWNSQARKFFSEIAEEFVSGAPLPEKIEAVLADATGEIRASGGQWLRASKSRTTDGGFVIICSDITVLKEREANLRIAKEQAEAANQSKSEFLAHMSHELRTPLNAILGFSEIIRDSLMGPALTRYSDYARDIHHAGEHLLRLINDVLDLSKIEVGFMELNEERVDVHDVMLDCHQLVAGRAAQACLNLSIPSAPDVPALRADKRRVNQILLNLLSNAIKFTPPGGRISMSACCLATGDIMISVTDTGIGMAPEDIPIALEAFRQIDRAINRRFEGTGLGLPLVQRLVELHNGSLIIESSLGHGTAVKVVFPKERRIERAAQPCARSASDA